VATGATGDTRTGAHDADSDTADPVTADPPRRRRSRADFLDAGDLSNAAVRHVAHHGDDDATKPESARLPCGRAEWPTWRLLQGGRPSHVGRLPAAALSAARADRGPPPERAQESSKRRPGTKENSPRRGGNRAERCSPFSYSFLRCRVQLSRPMSSPREGGSQHGRSYWNYLPHPRLTHAYPTRPIFGVGIGHWRRAPNAMLHSPRSSTPPGRTLARRRLVGFPWPVPHGIRSADTRCLADS